jgi:hypothetical protein
MLTPVRAASSSSFPSQGSAAALSADGIVRAAATAVAVNQVESPDLTSAVTAKLNIMLLAVRARMVEALLDVLNATGDAISQPRDDDEPDLAFAARLADAIQKMPAAKIEAVERQLAAQGHAIPLRLLAEALRNPAGPEATRIAAYLETIGYKDRDLATRAVVRSYGQNDGSPQRPDQRPEISLHRDSVPVAARAAPASPPDAAAKVPANTTATAITNPTADPVEQPAMAAAIAAVEADEQPVAATSSFAEADAGAEASEAAISSEPEASAAATTAGEEAGLVEAGSVAAKADPIIPKTWTGIPASLSKDETDMIVVIIRDQEAEVLLEAVDVEPAIEIDVLLDDTLIADIPEHLRTSPDQAMLSNGIARQANPLAAPSPLEAAAARTAAHVQTPAETDLPSAARQTIDATYAPVMMKIVEGVPYAIQPYGFAKDETDDGASREMNREDHNGEPQQDEEDEAALQGEPDVAEAIDTTAADEDGVRIETSPAAAAPPLNDAGQPILMLPAPGQSAMTVPDEAYARYRRMVGWE